MNKTSLQKTVEVLYQDNLDRVYKYFYFKTLDRQTAEDLTSETFIKMAQKIQNQTVIEDNVKYLYGIAGNTWNSYLRKKYAENTMVVDDFESMSGYVGEMDTAWRGKSLEERALYYIDQLPEKQRVVAYGKLILKHKNPEIMKELSVSENYVKVTMRRAMRSLERLISGVPEDKNERT